MGERPVFKYVVGVVTNGDTGCLEQSSELRITKENIRERVCACFGHGTIATQTSFYKRDDSEFHEALVRLTELDVAKEIGDVLTTEERESLRNSIDPVVIAHIEIMKQVLDKLNELDNIK